jgi:hypothetical protein
MLVLVCMQSRVNLHPSKLMSLKSYYLLLLCYVLPTCLQLSYLALAVASLERLNTQFLTDFVVLR